MDQRRALVVGIDHYDSFPQLRCAVRDAKRIASLSAWNHDGSPNYEARLVVSGPEQPRVSRGLVRALWASLFDNFDGDVFFYFSGHGAQTPWGGHLVTQDGTRTEPGVSMEDLLLLANRSRARDIVLILDCCHSGEVGNPPILQGLEEPLALLRDGITILAASGPDELAYEGNAHGLFTDAIAEGLSGGAADLMGNVTAASLFLYAERLFGAWDQRPLYKSYTSAVSTLRWCEPPIASAALRSLTTYFADPDAYVELDPEYAAAVNPGGDNATRTKKSENWRNFKRLRDARLIEGVDGEDLENTALKSGKICLTSLGKYYWRLLDRGRI